MNIFQKAINDIFNHDDFLEDCFIENVPQKCVCSRMEDGILYTEAGLENEADFTLDFKLPLIPTPKINDKLEFRGVTYKIASITTDSANTSVKIHLLDLTQR